MYKNKITQALLLGAGLAVATTRHSPLLQRMFLLVPNLLLFKSWFVVTVLKSRLLIRTKRKVFLSPT